MAEVDGGGLVAKDLDAAAGVVVTLFEVREGGGGAAAEGELGREFGPVEFGCGSSLRRVLVRCRIRVAGAAKAPSTVNSCGEIRRTDEAILEVIPGDLRGSGRSDEEH